MPENESSSVPGPGQYRSARRKEETSHHFVDFLHDLITHNRSVFLDCPNERLHIVPELFWCEAQLAHGHPHDPLPFSVHAPAEHRLDG